MPEYPVAITGLPRILREFRQIYPQINLELSVGQSDQLYKRLNSGQLDLVFVKWVAGAKDGTVVANYTNGQTKAQGQVVLANFANPQGLQQLGDTAWAETFASGQALRGEAGNSGFGLIQDIDVRLTVELGRTDLPLREVLSLGEDSVVMLDRLTDEPLTIPMRRTVESLNVATAASLVLLPRFSASGFIASARRHYRRTIARRR